MQVMKKQLIGTLLLFSSLFSFAENEQRVMVQGKFKIENHPEELHFEVNEKGEELVLREDGKENSSGCQFVITRISAPQQSRGMDGIIFADLLNDKPCQFSLENKELEKILNQVQLINIGYRLNNKAKVFGNIELQTLKKDYRSKF